LSQLNPNFKSIFQNLRKIESDLAGEVGRGAFLRELFANQSWFLATYKQNMLINRKNLFAKTLQQYEEQNSKVEEFQADNLLEEVRVENLAIKESDMPNEMPKEIKVADIKPSEMDRTLESLEAFKGVAQELDKLTMEVRPLNKTTIQKDETLGPNFQSHFVGEINIDLDLNEIKKNSHILSFQSEINNFTSYTIEQYLEKNSESSELNGTSQVDFLLLSNPGSGDAELQTLDFQTEIGQLLVKMAKALGGENHKVAFTQSREMDSQNGVLSSQKFYGECLLLRPKLVIAMGALASNFLLGRKERLSFIHGKIFSVSVKTEKIDPLMISFMPIYHPEFLTINPNMKRSTWEDMKSAMSFVSKS